MLTRVPEEFLNVFRVASTKEVKFTLSDEKAASRLRFKLNKIRARMRVENHPLIDMAERVEFQLRGNTVIATPRAGDYMDYIMDALQPHKELLEQAKLKEETADNEWLAAEAIRLSELQDRVKSRKVEQGKSVQDMLSGGGKK